MIKYLKFVEIAQIGMIIFSIYMSYKRWNIDRTNALIFLGLSVLLIITLYFKRRFRSRYEERRKNPDKKE